MKTELILREKIQLGDFNNIETYVNITYTNYSYFEFNPNGTPPIVSYMLPIYIFDSSFNLVGSFTVDSYETLSPTQWAIYTTEVFDFTGMTGLILTQSPTYILQRNIDLFDDVSIPITYSIADIQDISKKSSAKTTTIKVPGTPNNNKVFKNVFYIASSDTFRLNYATDAVILYDTSTLLEGVFMLTKVIKLRDEIQYEGVVYTSVIGLFTAMGDKLLYGNVDPADDLDFSEYTHVLNGTNILDSLTTNPGSGYTYIPIDKFGQWSLSYVNNSTNNPPSAGSFKYSEMTLCLFVREIWDKIFKKHGFDWFSNFLNDIIYLPTHHTGDFEFGRLIYPNVSKYTLIDNVNKYVKLKETSFGVLSLSTSDTYPPYSKTTFANYVLAEDEDPQGIYNSTTGNITITDNGLYNVNISAECLFYYDGGGSQANAKLYVGYYPTTNSYFNVVNIHTFTLYKNGSILTDNNGNQITTSYTINNAEGYMLFDNTGKYYLPVATLNPEFDIKDIKLLTGDVLSFKHTISSTFRSSTGVYLYTKQTGPTTWVNIPISLVSKINKASIQISRTDFGFEGNTIDPTTALGKKMKQSDFINSIIKMFNLYIEPASTTLMLVNPRDYYYLSSSTPEESWSPKLDISNPIEIERTSDIVDKRVNIKYKKDKDYFNEEYINKYSVRGTNYGEYLQESSTLINDKYNIEIGFAPTICGPLNNPDWYVGNQLNNCECPKIFSASDNDNTTSTLTDDLTVSYKEYEPRILYWQGLVEKLITTTGNYANGDIKIYNDTYTSQITIPTGYFPNASMFDKPFGADEFTLDFANNDKYWVNLNGTNPTYQNMYWMYYRNMINEYTDPDGKLVTLYIYLTDKDIAQLNLSQEHMIDGVRYHVNKIENFVPNRPTKVELIKIP